MKKLNIFSSSCIYFNVEYGSRITRILHTLRLKENVSLEKLRILWLPLSIDIVLLLCIECRPLSIHICVYSKMSTDDSSENLCAIVLAILFSKLRCHKLFYNYWFIIRPNYLFCNFPLDPRLKSSEVAILLEFGNKNAI